MSSDMEGITHRDHIDEEQLDEMYDMTNLPFVDDGLKFVSLFPIIKPAQIISYTTVLLV